MTVRTFALLLLGAGLLVGCPPVTDPNSDPNTDPNSDPNAPDPNGPTSVAAMSPGIYRGTETWEAEHTLNGDLINSDSGVTPAIAQIGIDGLPLTHDGENVYEGYSSTETIADQVSETTITSIREVGDSIVIDSNVTVTFDVLGTPLTMRGTEIIVYTRIDDRNIERSKSTFVTATSGGNTLTIRATTDAELSR